jgi:hypothetical protein
MSNREPTAAPRTPGQLPPNALTDGFKTLLQQTARTLKGSSRRKFVAQTVQELGRGGQRWAERELGWNRGLIQKGTHELERGIDCLDACAARGRKKAEEHWPHLLQDIRDIVEPQSQTDYTFKTTKLYIRFTAKAVRNQLMEQKGYTDDQLPTARTIGDKLNHLGHFLKTVIKNKPLKKIPETDAIFEQVHRVNTEADETERVLRLSMDAKAAAKIGPFSRGGQSRVKTEAADHDFGSECTLIPYNILLPEHDELFVFFALSKVTSDFIWDRVEELWPAFKLRYDPTMLVINQDNGPENSSRRTQFIKRAVDFVNQNNVTVRLAYYPPYHSKYNIVERTHGVLENYWNGTLLVDIETALGMARSMTWKGKHPAVRLVTDIYETGVKLTRKAMAIYEKMIERLPGLENWFVDIKPCTS